MKINYLAILGALCFLGCKEKTADTGKAQTFPVIQLSSGAAITYQEFPASIEGRDNIEIRPQVDGILERIFVDEGAHVFKGQPLFLINDSPFREKLHNAIASLQAAKGLLENARIEVDKIIPLVDRKVVAEYQLKTAKSVLSVAEARVEQAKADVATANINLAYTLIKAPIDGYIGRLSHKKGSLVSTADPNSLTVLSDVHQVHVYFALGEYDFILFKQQFDGRTLDEKLKKLPPVALVLADDSLYTHQGRIDMIDGQFNKATGAITVRATFPNEDGLLRSGNTGRVKLGLRHSAQIMVPQASTLDMQDKLYVFQVGKDNKVKKQMVSISGTTGKNFLVKEGLKAGDRIVYAGFELLREGDTINPENLPSSELASSIIKN